MTVIGYTVEFVEPFHESGALKWAWHWPKSGEIILSMRDVNHMVSYTFARSPISRKLIAVRSVFAHAGRDCLIGAHDIISETVNERNSQKYCISFSAAVLAFTHARQIQI